MEFKSLILALLIVSAASAATTSGWSSIIAGGESVVVDLLYHPAYPKTYPAQIQPGDRGVWLDVEMVNHFTMNYYDISGELEITGPFTGVVTHSEIENAKPREAVHSFYQLNVNENAKPGEYKMRHRLTYHYDQYDDSGNRRVRKVETVKTVVVNVYYSERVEITRVELPESVLPGDSFEARVFLENTGSVTVNDVAVSYEISTDAELVSIMTIGSSMKRLPSIKPGETAEVSFPMRVSETAAVKGYGLEVSAKYTSNAATTVESDRVAINVIGMPKIRLAGVQTDKDLIYSGSPFSISVQMENIGTGDAKSVKAVLRDGVLTGVLTSYVGTVETDNTGSAIFDLVDPEPGRKVVAAVISFEDSYGNSYDEEIELDYFVTERPADYTLAMAAVVLVALGAFWLWRSSEKKKRIQRLVK